MTMNLLEQLTAIDPHPVDAEPPSGAMSAAAVLNELEWRTGMNTKHIPTNDTPRRPWIAVAAFAVVIVVGVIAVMTMRSDEGVPADDPIVTTTLGTATTTIFEETDPQGFVPDRLPGFTLDEPAGIYGWTSDAGGSIGMHFVVPIGSSDSRQTQLVFKVQSDCFPAGGDPIPGRVAGFDAKYVEPYDSANVTFLPWSDTGETTGAYALRVGDRTLCAYLTWDQATTDEELAAGKQIIGSIRARPHGQDGLQINFTLPRGWDRA